MAGKVTRFDLGFVLSCELNVEGKESIVYRDGRRPRLFVPAASGPWEVSLTANARGRDRGSLYIGGGSASGTLNGGGGLSSATLRTPWRLEVGARRVSDL